MRAPRRRRAAPIWRRQHQIEGSATAELDKGSERKGDWHFGRNEREEIRRTRVLCFACLVFFLGKRYSTAPHKNVLVRRLVGDLRPAI
jgi:hypothetical protein